MNSIELFYQIYTPVVELVDFHPTVKVWMKRDELIHPILSGNKWRKLKYNLIEARDKGIQTLVTKGGYYSNHLAAVSEAGKLFGFKTIGVVRGEKPDQFGYTLKCLVENQMKLIFTTRKDFVNIDESNYQDYIDEPENSYYLPEGGTNLLAIKGCQELIPEVLSQIDFIPETWCVSVGTGGTIAGMLKSLPLESKLLGFSALKGNFHKEEIESKFGIKTKGINGFEITDRFAGKGYAKVDSELIDFVNKFYDQYQIPLDPVYTGKMMLGIKQLATEGYFPDQSIILCIHTGGLQGINGYKEAGYSFGY